MQPTLLAPVPVAVFRGGALEIKARYNSGTGAPMEACTVGVRTASVSCAAASAEVDGEGFSGTVRLADIQQLDPGWEVGDRLTVVASTREAGEWSETRYDAATCGPPEVSLVEGSGIITGFPHIIAWDYGDFPGWWQCRYELAIRGSRLMGEVSVAGYSSEPMIELTGEEVGFGADFGGTLDALSCTLRVESTSGASAELAFDVAIDGSVEAPEVSASVDDGRLLVESSAPFELFAIGKGGGERAAWTKTGSLMFDLPDAASRYCAVTLGSGRVGRADEVPVQIGRFPCSYLDYIAGGERKRLELRYNPEESASMAGDSEMVRYAGRANPVRAFVAMDVAISASAVAMEPLDLGELQDELRGIEAVYRSGKGGIWRVVVDSVRWARARGKALAGEVELSMTVVDGSPYGLLYDSPVYVDRMLYPGPDVYPGPNLYPGVQRG